MGKIILEFDSIEESHDALTAMNAMKWKMAMWDLDQELRATTKHGSPLLGGEAQATDVEIEAADKLREKIREILNGYNLNLND